MSDEPIHICTEMPLPPELVAAAAARAVEENPANAGPQAAMLKAHGLASFSDMPPELYLALPIGKMWRPGRTLTVWLNGGSDKVRGKVQQYAREWEQYANLTLRFVDAAPADLRVTFTPGGSWSYLGTDNLTVPAGNPTMNYGWLNDGTAEDEFARVILHEFGHALGCIHEHQSPAANIPWNREAVYAYYQRTQGWSRAQVDQNIFTRYAANSTQFSAFDPLSIMLYAIPASLTTDGYSTGWNTRLSMTDEDFIDAVYPLPGFRIFHQGWGNNGEMWRQRTRDASSWARDTMVQNVGISAGPSPVSFQGKLYVFHQGWGNNGELWYSVMANGQWGADVKVPNTGMSSSPSAVVFQNKLYVFHQGWGNNGELWYNVFDGSSWAGDTQVGNTGMSSGPSAVVFQDKLYVFHQGWGNNGELWYNIFDGSGWAGDTQVGNTGMSSGPSAVVFQGRLYVFHQGWGNNGELWYGQFDGSNWLGDTKVPNTGISSSPSAVLNGAGTKIFVFHQGWGDNGQLWCNAFDGSNWAGDTQAPDTGMSSGPGAIWTTV